LHRYVHTLNDVPLLEKAGMGGKGEKREKREKREKVRKRQRGRKDDGMYAWPFQAIQAIHGGSPMLSS